MSQTYINQWLERTLDDSAIKRIIYPECFLLLEHILNESIKCISSLVINENKIKNDKFSTEEELDRWYRNMKKDILAKEG